MTRRGFVRALGTLAAGFLAGPQVLERMLRPAPDPMQVRRAVKAYDTTVGSQMIVGQWWRNDFSHSSARLDEQTVGNFAMHWRDYPVNQEA